jgi:transposase
MNILDAGFDIHRSQITFDALDTETGEVTTGRIASTPEAVAKWVERYPDREIHVAIEACTGWFFVSQALESAGAVVHLAEVTETRALRGKKRRAKTDRADARWLRTLLSERRLPEAWIPPEHICFLRMRTRLRKTLKDEQTAWRQRIQATLFHLGKPSLPEGLKGERARQWISALDLPDGACERIEVSFAMIEAAQVQLEPIDKALREFARRQAGCKAIIDHFGIGEVTAPVIIAELGDVSRLKRSRQAVRMAGLDIGVYRSDQRSKVGKITKQGSPHLRWALFEAAQSACRDTSPDHDDYLVLRERGLSHTRASLTIARKLARRCFHSLRELGDESIASADEGETDQTHEKEAISELTAA